LATRLGTALTWRSPGDTLDDTQEATYTNRECDERVRVRTLRTAACKDRETLELS